MPPVESAFVPPDFVLPLALETERFRLEPRDLEPNLGELERPAQDFESRTGFTYTVPSSEWPTPSARARRRLLSRSGSRPCRSGRESRSAVAGKPPGHRAPLRN